MITINDCRTIYMLLVISRPTRLIPLDVCFTRGAEIYIYSTEKKRQVVH